jgi:hypothetical protein
MYYKMLYKMFGSQELALAAYHTGPAYVLRHKQPAPCSKRYVSGIMKDYYWLKAHTDPAVLKHKMQQERARKQAEAKAAAEKEAAEARAKAQAEAANQANGTHEANAESAKTSPDV